MVTSTDKAHSDKAAITGYVDTTELAALLKLHPTTLIKWRGARRGPPFTRMGQKVLYNLSKFHQWLEDQEVKPIR